MKINIKEVVSKAVDVSLSHANQEWKNEAIKRTLWLAKHKKTFTSDDVITHLELKGLKTKNKSALGGIMRRAFRNGWIKPEGYTASRRPSRHLAPVRVWRSLINIEDYKKNV